MRFSNGGGLAVPIQTCKQIKWNYRRIQTIQKKNEASGLIIQNYANSTTSAVRIIKYYRDL